eukprot:scaffold56035_cov41-Attheya_sp.AAC.1
MEYDLARARNVDAAPVAMYWTARDALFPSTTSTSTRDRLFPLRSLRRSYGSLGYGMVVQYVVTLSIVRPSVRSVPP